MVELGPVVGMHVKVRQRGLANIDAVSDPRLPCFLRAPASGSVVQLPRHILPHLYIRMSYMYEGEYVSNLRVCSIGRLGTELQPIQTLNPVLISDR